LLGSSFWWASSLICSSKLESQLRKCPWRTSVATPVDIWLFNAQTHAEYLQFLKRNPQTKKLHNRVERFKMSHNNCTFVICYL
jgi:hypothetical protein